LRSNGMASRLRRAWNLPQAAWHPDPVGHLITL